MPGFDEAYYLEHHPTVRHSADSPLQHYLQHGWKDGCDPSVGFSSSEYLAANPDVAASGRNPLAHFLEHGLAEGRGGWRKGFALDEHLSIDQRVSADWFSDNNAGLPLIFMYWESRNLAEPISAPSWRSFYPNFRVFYEEDVIPLLPEKFVDLFVCINIPAAKSDIARMYLLKEYGGLYIDAHVGPASSANLMMTLSRLAGCNLMLFSRKWMMGEGSDFLDLMNTVIAARKGAPELDLVIDKIVRNVREHKRKEEEASEYVPYDLFNLTGTWLIVESFLEVPALTPRVKVGFRENVIVNLMESDDSSGFHLYKFHEYRKQGNHWSERQRYERFFETEEITSLSDARARAATRRPPPPRS
ncbi:MAG: hypothetical protein MIN69_06185 [Methylorubrum extorquens]|jgi:hypothetical protein|nr:glycosyltransferase [Methylorubrum extorquens]